MNKTIMVVGAVIKKDDKIFITKRADGDKEAIYKWEFPGGSVEDGETNDEALKREMMEEFMVNIQINKFLTRICKEYENHNIDISFYLCETNDEFIMQEDHLDYKWVTKEELSLYEFAPVDQEFVNKIGELL